MKKLGIIVILGLLSASFYYNFSNFYSFLLLFTLDQDNYDILAYFFSIGDFLISFLEISILPSLKFNFNHYLIQKIYFLVFQFQEFLICLGEFIRSPPSKNFLPSFYF